MKRLSHAPPPGQTARRYTRKPFEVSYGDRPPRYATLAAAELRAQEIADRTGAHVNLYDHDHDHWRKVQPKQYRCQGCRQPVSPAEWPEVWRRHCADCRAARAQSTPMSRKRKIHPVPDSGFWRCLAAYDGSQCRCGSVYHALEIDPAGAPPCGHPVQEHGAAEVAPAVLGFQARVSDLQRCRAVLQAWVLRVDRAVLLQPRFDRAQLLKEQPEPDNPLRAAWALLWWSNNAEAAAWLRREIDERLAAEGHEVAA